MPDNITQEFYTCRPCDGVHRVGEICPKAELCHIATLSGMCKLPKGHEPTISCPGKSLGTPESMKTDPTEYVNHPAHYGGENNPYEAIKVIEAWELGFNLGNCVKYISRAGKKGDIEIDLEKARWYLDREISNLRNRQTTT